MGCSSSSKLPDVQNIHNCAGDNLETPLEICSASVTKENLNKDCKDLGSLNSDRITVTTKCEPENLPKSKSSNDANVHEVVCEEALNRHNQGEPVATSAEESLMNESTFHSNSEIEPEIKSNFEHVKVKQILPEDISNVPIKKGADVNSLVEISSICSSKQKIVVGEETMSSSGHGGEDPQNKLIESQQKFDAAIHLSCGLFNAKSVLDYATADVECLQLHRSLPPSLSLTALLEKLPHLQEVDISGNSLGPQAFRAIMLSLSHNNSIISLNIANNYTDTDSAVCIGEMLTTNTYLQSLDVSGNYLGKDFFSRCVGPALTKNTTLQVLRCESIGSTDMTSLIAGAQNNRSLLELRVSHNDIADSTTFTQNLVEMLKGPECCLSTLALKNCGLKVEGMNLLASCLQDNTSIQQLTISGNQVSCSESLKNFLVVCVCHPALTHLWADDISFANSSSAFKFTPDPNKAVGKASVLQVISLSNCQLSEGFFTLLLESLSEGSLSQVNQLTLANNPGLSPPALKPISRLISEPGKICCLQKLSLGLNPVDDIVGHMSSNGMHGDLTYLNLRKAKVSTGSLAGLSSLLKTLANLETLVLDGIKLAGTSLLSNMLENTDGNCSLIALSMAGCSLADKDLVPLISAIARGLPLHMLKLAANRFGDSGVIKLAGSLLGHSTHPMALMDLSKNKVGSGGAQKLAELFVTSQSTKIHSLNLSNNSIGSDGLIALVQHVGCTSLRSLNVCNQQATCEEEDMDEVFLALTRGLGVTVSLQDNQVIPPDIDLPTPIPAGISFRATSLGGYPGEVGIQLDSIAVSTDFSAKRLPHLSFSDALELAAVFKGKGSSGYTISQKEWNSIIGADKEAPSWLQVSSRRCLAVYMTHLPASVTVPKMEGVLEMEADCNVQEIVLMKDPVTRQNNGLAWALLSDQESVKKAVQHYHSGQARLFGQPFIICAVQVHVDDQATQEAEASARADIDRRRQDRQQENIAHRALIRQSYLESQARHAYRLAHPAYADGRIW